MSDKFSIFARIIAAAFLLFALGSQDYSYYVLLRWVVTACAVYMFTVADDLMMNSWKWTFGAVGVLFNPIVPVHLSKDAWTPIDFITALIFLGSFFFLKEPKYDEDEFEEYSEPIEQEDEFASTEEHGLFPATKLKFSEALVRIEQTNEISDRMIVNAARLAKGEKIDMEQHVRDIEESYRLQREGMQSILLMASELEERGEDMSEFSEQIDSICRQVAQGTDMTEIGEGQTIHEVITLLKSVDAATHFEIVEYIRSLGKFSIRISDSLQKLYGEGVIVYDQETEKWSLVESKVAQ